jgi:hypothetical protein
MAEEETQREKELLHRELRRLADKAGLEMGVAITTAWPGDLVYARWDHPVGEHHCLHARDGIPPHVLCSGPHDGVVRYLFGVPRAVLCEVEEARDRAVLTAFPGEHARREEYASIEAALRALPAFLEGARAESQ